MFSALIPNTNMASLVEVVCQVIDMLQAVAGEMEMLEPCGITRGLQEIRLQTLQSPQDLHPAAPINCETGGDSSDTISVTGAGLPGRTGGRDKNNNIIFIIIIIHRGLLPHSTMNIQTWAPHKNPRATH